MIVGPSLRDAGWRAPRAIVSADPYLYFARLTQWWAPHTRPCRRPACIPAPSSSPARVIAPHGGVGALAYVGQRCVDRQRRGHRCALPRRRDAVVGADTRLMAQVTLPEGCRIGARGIVHSGVVIGADGFGFAPDDGRWVKIEQLGAVRIGDDVEIGANTCIDRGALDDTVIEDGVKLDNLIQIGHNVRIGAHTRHGRLRRRGRQRAHRRALHLRRRRHASSAT